MYDKWANKKKSFERNGFPPLFLQNRTFEWTIFGNLPGEKVSRNCRIENLDVTCTRQKFRDIISITEISRTRNLIFDDSKPANIFRTVRIRFSPSFYWLTCHHDNPGTTANLPSVTKNRRRGSFDIGLFDNTPLSLEQTAPCYEITELCSESQQLRDIDAFTPPIKSDKKQQREKLLVDGNALESLIGHV